MSKYVVICDWDSAPHLTREMKESLLASIPEEQRDARTKGIPYMGAGLIFPVPEDRIKVPAFQIPATFKRAYGFDTGWKVNAVVWGALDPTTDVCYIYDVFKRGAAEPPVMTAAIQSRGAWIPGVADAADISRLDGISYLELYQNSGLDVVLPNKAFQTGIDMMWMRLSTGRLKVFDTCTEFFEEYRIYSRSENGTIPRGPNAPRFDLMDACRYLIISGLDRAKFPPTKPDKWKKLDYDSPHGQFGWMG